MKKSSSSWVLRPQTPLLPVAGGSASRPSSVIHFSYPSLLNISLDFAILTFVLSQGRRQLSEIRGAKLKTGGGGGGGGGVGGAKF